MGITYDSEVSTITNADMQVAFTLLWQTSPAFREMMVSIDENGFGDITIKTVDGDSVKDTDNISVLR